MAINENYVILSYKTNFFLYPFCTPFGDVCMTQLKYYLRWKVCTTSRYLYEVGYPMLNSFLIPHLDTLYQLSQKCVTYRKYIHRSILHFSLGEIGMGRNIMCFLSWLACFPFLQILVIVLVLRKFSNIFLVNVVFMGTSMTMCVWSRYTRTPILIKTIF